MQSLTAFIPNNRCPLPCPWTPPPPSYQRLRGFSSVVNHLLLKYSLLLICFCSHLTNGFLDLNLGDRAESEMTICQLLIPRYKRRCLPINNNLSKTKHPNVINSVGQKDRDDRNLQVFNYLQFSYQFLDTTNCTENEWQYFYLFLKCHILIQFQDIKWNIRLQNMSSGREPHLNINMTNKRHTSQENQNTISIDQQYILCFSLKANIFLFSC